MIKNLRKSIILQLGIVTNVVTLMSANSLALASEKRHEAIMQTQSIKISNFEKRIEALEKIVQSLVQNQSAYEKTVIPNSNSKELIDDQQLSQPQVAINTDKMAYDLALASLKEGKFTEAEEKFTNFMLKYPQSKLRENALFWYSESFYKRDDFNQSAINYLKLYKEYPKGTKTPDALLKLSLSLDNLGKTKEACKILDKLDIEFPKLSADFKEKVRSTKTKFNCNNKTK